MGTSLGRLILQAGWRLVGTGDVNGDGKDDLLWMNDGAHQFAYWTMDSTRRLGYKIFKITPGYFPVLTGDFNGDGSDDIVWNAADHSNWGYWLMSGPKITSASFQANQGSCPATAPCSFAAPAPPVAWPSGQRLLNAGLATGGK